MTSKLLLLAVVALTEWTNHHHRTANGLDNGLARTPPMGWMSWTKFACNTNCAQYPHECINEQLYKDMIDRIVADGYLSAGYNTVNLDDCWTERGRDHSGVMVADHVRFPSGIKALADYAHARHVQLGIYSDVGTQTCGGYIGTRTNNQDHTDLDAKTFSDWGVDSLKLDHCNADASHFNESYPEFTKAFAKQTHKIVYACSWPMRFAKEGLSDRDYELVRASCNYWRNYNDINDSWDSVRHIINFYGQHGKQFAKFHGPGGWFDPDMLLIGNDGLSYEQAKAQMAFWCLWSAPLLMSNDLREVKPEMKAILLNKHLIAIDQDPLGHMGQLVVDEGKKYKQVWVKRLSPSTSGGKSRYVVLYFNTNNLGVAAFMSYRLTDLISDLDSTVSYDVLDVFANETKLETLKATDHLTLKVRTSGSVRMVKLVPV